MGSGLPPSSEGMAGTLELANGRYVSRDAGLVGVRCQPIGARGGAKKALIDSGESLLVLARSLLERVAIVANEPQMEADGEEICGITTLYNRGGDGRTCLNKSN